MRDIFLFLAVAVVCFACVAPRAPAQESFGYVLQTAETKAFCGDGKVKYWDNGRIRECVLARDTLLDGQVVPAGTWVGFLGGLKLKKEDQIDACSVGRYVMFHGIFLPKYSVVFPPRKEDGTIGIRPDREIVVQGHRVQRAEEGRGLVMFYENGCLQQALASRGFTIQGHAFKRGDLVSLGPDGKLDLAMKWLEKS